MSVILIVSVLIFPPYSSSQVYISDIFLERKPMFDTSGSRSFFASKFLNSLHTDTKPYIISDELLFSKGDKIEIDLIDETERNLRALDIFSNIRIEFDSTNYDTYDVYVVTSDRWSTFPIPLLGSGGGEYTIGGRLEEMNFLGMNYKLRLEALYRTENDIGWQGYFTFKKKRLFRTE